MEWAQQNDVDITVATPLHSIFSNEVYRLSVPRLVVKRTSAGDERIHKAVRMAEWLGQKDIAAVRLSPRFGEQPFSLSDGSQLTVWEDAGFDNTRAPAWRHPHVMQYRMAAMAKALAELHAAGRPPFELPQWDPLGRCRRQLNQHRSDRPSDVDFLQHWLEDVDARLQAAEDEEVVIHGDAFSDNIILPVSVSVPVSFDGEHTPTPKGILCDFDTVAVGTRYGDLAYARLVEKRIGVEGLETSVKSAYGVKEFNEPLMQTCTEVQELRAICGLLPHLDASPAIAAEFDRRIETERTQQPTMFWLSPSTLADLTRRNTERESAGQRARQRSGAIPELVTRQATLRGWSAGDAVDLFHVLNERGVVQHRQKPTVSLRDCENRVYDYRLDFQNEGVGRWSVWAGEPDRLMGYAGLRRATDLPGMEDHWELGVRLHPDGHATGLPREVIAAVCDRAFADERIDSVVAYFHPDHLTSRAIAHEMGFEPVGRTTTHSGIEVDVLRLTKMTYEEQGFSFKLPPDHGVGL